MSSKTAKFLVRLFIYPREVFPHVHHTSQLKAQDKPMEQCPVQRHKNLRWCVFVLWDGMVKHPVLYRAITCESIRSRGTATLN